MVLSLVTTTVLLILLSLLSLVYEGQPRRPEYRVNPEMMEFMTVHVPSKFHFLKFYGEVRTLGLGAVGGTARAAQLQGIKPTKAPTRKDQRYRSIPNLTLFTQTRNLLLNLRS